MSATVREGSEGFHALNPETHQYQYFGAGSEVPDELAATVNPDLLDGYEATDTDTGGDTQHDDAGPFDPTQNVARAVYDHLDSLPDTAEGKAEYDRVVAAEKAGDNRKSAIPAREFTGDDGANGDGGGAGEGGQ